MLTDRREHPDGHPERPRNTVSPPTTHPETSLRPPPHPSSTLTPSSSRSVRRDTRAELLTISPLAAPGVFTCAILVFIFCWNDFLFAISLTSTDRARTVPAALAFFTGSSQYEDPTGAISTATVTITIPIIVFVLLFQRRIVSGLTSGAVKG